MIGISQVQKWLESNVGDSTEQIAQVSILNKSSNQLVKVSTLMDLPDAVKNKGRFIWVDSINDYRYSDGWTWVAYGSSEFNVVGVQKTAWAWGYGSWGMIGDNSSGHKSSPVSVVGGFTWKQVSIANSSVAIRSDGIFWGWGLNSNGELGNNVTGLTNSPVSLISPCNSWNWKQVSSLGATTLAIKSDDTLWSWGSNGGGRLGDGSTVNRSSPVSLISPCNSWTWKQVSKGNVANAIRSDGTLWSWGYGSYGEIGNGNTSNMSSPVSLVAPCNSWTWKQVGGSIAIKSDDTLWGWGYNSGSIGNGNTSNMSSPVSLVAPCNSWTWKQVSTLGGVTTAIKSDDTLWSWGINTYGQLGDGTTINRTSPVSVVGGFTWKQVCSGSDCVLAIRSNDTLWAWGKNDYGKLGTGNVTLYSSPVSVVGGFTWKQVSVNDTYNALAIPITKGF